MTLREIRERLGMSRSELARALNVNERTVARWEEGTDPGGLAKEVIDAIQEALDDGLDPRQARRVLGTGIGTMIHLELMKGCKVVS